MLARFGFCEATDDAQFLPHQLPTCSITLTPPALLNAVINKQILTNWTLPWNYLASSGRWSQVRRHLRAALPLMGVFENSPLEVRR